MATTTMSRTATGRGEQLTLDFFFAPNPTTEIKAAVEKIAPPKTRQGRGELLYAQGAVRIIEETLRDVVLDGAVIQQRVERGVYKVEGSKGNSYEVRVRGGRPFSCICPDSQRQQKESCKHQYAVRAHIQSSDLISQHTHDLCRFQGMLANPQPHGLSEMFVERAASTARRKLRELGVEPEQEEAVQEEASREDEFADLFA